MFIREPKFGRFVGAGDSPNIVGAALSGLAWSQIVAAVLEATLIEEIAWSALEFSTQAGSLVVAVDTGTGTKNVVGAYPLGAGSASLWASGRITLNLTLPVGASLHVMHDVQNGGGYTNLNVNALGGIVR